MLTAVFEDVVDAAVRACLEHYGERLVGLVLFGSVARGTVRYDSDVDLLVVADPLPRGRLARMGEFSAVEEAASPALEAATQEGVHTTLSPVLKTPGELRRGSLLLLDMTDQGRVLLDRDGTVEEVLGALRARLADLGARRVYRGGGYYWLLHPGLVPGEKVTL